MPGRRIRTRSTAQAARTFAAWRSDGTLSKDRQPSLYVYEQEYTVPGTSLRRAQRGFYGRLRLEAFGPGGGVLPARADARRPEGGPLQAHARVGRQLLGRDGPLRRRHRDRAPPPRGGHRGRGRRGRDRRRRRPAPPLDGPRGRPDGAAGRGAARGGRARAGHDRRRPPSLRDGAPLPGRAPHDPLGRRRPAVRLPARAVHGHVGRAAPRAAHAPRGARRERRRWARRGSVLVGPLRGGAGRSRGAPRGVRPGGAGAGRSRPDRALDARRAARC